MTTRNKGSGRGSWPAIVKIMREAGAPLTVWEILERATEKGITLSRSKTPKASIERDLALGSMGDSALFERTAPSRYTLRQEQPQ